MAPGSFLLAEELFQQSDPAFVGELIRCGGGKQLKRFAVKWAATKGGFARATRLDLADRAIAEGHARVLVKTLFKAAEQRGDDVEVTHHLVAFDRHVTRRTQQVRIWDGDARTSSSIWRRDLVRRRRPGNPWEWQGPPEWFSTSTRYYLQRRALRYLRRLGQESPARFLNAALLALSLYDDEHFPAVDSILDCRSLCLLLYGRAEGLWKTGRRLDLQNGYTLSELRPAPMFDGAWRSATAFEPLLMLVVSAPAGFVRGWCVSWLRLAHEERLVALPLERLRPLLASPHGEAQALGAELLDRVETWGQLPVEGWLELLRLDNTQALIKLARLMERHVTPDRLSLAQCLELSQSRVRLIAELGLRWAMDKGLAEDDAITAANALADAENENVRRRGMDWLRPRLSDKKRSLLLRDLVDSRHPDVRRVALDVSAAAPYTEDARVHAAMAESPYGDVTDALAERLKDWKGTFDESSLQHLWATILLSARRGSRAKRKTLRVLAQRAVAQPDKAADLLPLVAVALRSVREAERRAALATLARAAFADPELKTLIEEHIGELAFEEVEAAAG
ncbi:MAG: hypothetical protein AAF928_03635 [Myxococcota bacterium]